MAIVRRLIEGCTLFLTLGVGLLKADQLGLDHFGYLNNNESAAIIEQTEAQDLLNVDVTAGGKSVKKRAGYGLYKTLTVTTAMHGGIHFYDSSGNDVQVWGSSTSLWGIVADGTPTLLVSSATLNTTWDCADTQGSAYCVTSNRNALIKTTGATQSWSTSPLGTMITVTPLRLVIAGVSGAANTLYYSQANTFTNFVVGNAATDAFTEVIAAPGARLTNIEYACGKVLWWKDQSFGYVLGSEDQTKVQVVTVSNSVGSQDNSVAIEPDGAVHFRAQDGHFYRYDCSSLEKLSVDITPNVQTSANRTSGAYTVSSVSDFSGGSVSSTTITSTGVEISTNDVNIPDNSIESVSWSNGGGSGWTLGSPATTIHCTSVAQNGSYVAGFQSTATPTCSVDLVDASSLSSYGTAAITWVDNACTWTQRTLTVTGAKKAYAKVKLVCNGNIIYSPPFAASGNSLTYYTRTDTNTGAVRQVEVDNFGLGQTTLVIGTYQSPIKNAPNLTSWDTFNANKTDGNGTQTFFMRSSSNSFTVTSSTPGWTSVTNGAVITITTGTYFQWKDSFTVVAATQTPSLQNATVNWFEGSASDKAYATYFENAIWWSVTFGSGQSTNNYIFRFDLLNPGWGLYNFGANGFLIQNNRLYFGSTAADGRIYRFGNATDDNGSAISAYWQSKDFPGQDPWLENEYTQFDTIARRNTGQTLTVTYTLSNSSATAFSLPLTSTTDAVIRHKKLLPTGKIGGLLNVKFSDNSSTSAWEVLGFRFLFRPLPYKPTQ